jgi:hypothetical protein
VIDASSDRQPINAFIRLACLGDLAGMRAKITDGFDPATPNEGAAENIVTSIIYNLEWESAEGWSPDAFEWLCWSRRQTRGMPSFAS